ncbi:hypothetical protein K435DRAFT_616619, partial [Dendrothele bispora CBS 962.96]
MPVCDVCTRLNYTHAMIHRVQKLQAAIDSWTFETPGIRGLLLNYSDWELLGQLADVLE